MAPSTATAPSTSTCADSGAEPSIDGISLPPIRSRLGGVNPEPSLIDRRRARRFSWVLCAPAALLLSLAGAARAGTANGEGEGTLQAGQRAFGVGVTVGVWSGAGLTFGGGSDAVKGWATAGYAPVLVFANAKADKALRFNYYSAYQLGADLAIPLKKRPRLELSLLLGYRFNSVLGHGGGAGVGVIYDLGRRVGLALSGGLTVFPSAQDRLDRNQGYPSDRDPALSTAIQSGANLGLIFFP
jgi:hypothetical protein